jgi:hypothetical protein
MGTYSAAMANLDKAMLHWRRPRPWRSQAESAVIKRLVWLWFNHRGPGQTRESIHGVARALGISRSYVQKLVRMFERDPSEMQREDRRHGPANIAQLVHAKAETKRQKECGLLRTIHVKADL